MNLKDLLIREGRDHDKVWFSDESWKGIDSILKDDFSLEKIKSKSQSCNIILTIFEPYHLARALVHLDGIANQILLLPSSLEMNDRESLIAKSQSEKWIRYEDGEYKLQEVGAGTTSISAGETNYVLSTSGTSGRPKLIRHTLRSLTRQMKKTDFYEDRTWGLLYDLSRFAGFQVFLQTLVNGSRLAFQSNTGRLSDTLNQFDLAQVNCLSATATMWRQILSSKENLDLIQITLGGEIADQSLLIALSNRFPLARIVHIYAMTEIGYVFSISDGQEGFPASYVENGYGKARFKINENNVLCADMNGDGNYFETGDLVRKTEDRYVFIGRENGSINVGGNKVMPEEVESVIRQIEGVQEVRVYGKANPIVGMLVNSDIVLQPNVTDYSKLESEIRNRCRRDLAAFKVPAKINFVKDLRVSSSGKISRRSS